MPLLRIEHRTQYFYNRPVSFGRHRLVLRPREGHDLRVESMALSITPAHQLTWIRDVFGNSVAIVDFVEPAAELEVFNDVVVRRSLPFPEQTPREPWRVAFPPVYDPLETTVIAAYQAVSYPDDVDEVKAWIMSELPSVDPLDAETTFFALGEVIHRTIKYQRRMEKGVQSPSQTLARRSGSCRDMATLMMDGVRALGAAARFAGGYLDCAASAAGRASTHAWTEIYLPDIGWRGFDPTLGRPTGKEHVAAGVSNHPRGVMPISGMFSGASGDYREMTVQVKIGPVSASS